MGLKEKIAEITIDPKNKQILNVRFFERNLCFRCQRCAVYCCKLGGPTLTEDDLKRLKSVGYNISDYVEPVKRRYGDLLSAINAIRTKEDGACVFLKKDETNGIYKCEVYDARPFLCRLFPFELKKTGINSSLLRFIPCCRGLNCSNGDLVDESFVAGLVLSIYSPPCL